MNKRVTPKPSRARKYAEIHRQANHGISKQLTPGLSNERAQIILNQAIADAVKKQKPVDPGKLTYRKQIAELHRMVKRQLRAT